MKRLIRSRSGRAITMFVIASALHSFIEPRNFLFALEVQRQKDARTREIARKLGVDPEFLLHPNRKPFQIAQVLQRLGITTQPATAAATQAPVNIRESVSRVKSRYALVAADTAIAKIARLVALRGDEVGKKRGSIRGELMSAVNLIDKDLLPPVADALPAVAKSRDREMRDGIERVRKAVRGVINNPQALDEANIESTLAQLRAAVAGTLAPRERKPRWTKDPFPLADVYRVAPKRSGSTSYAAATIAPSTAAKPVAAAAPPSEVAAFAASLKTPAKAFAWVHDHIDWDNYSGVAKGSLGTLRESSGNDWDQAVLLRDLLAAQGYQAQIEWGRVTLPIARAMNLVGTEDPLQAANLLATAGFDGVLLTNGSQPTAIQMTHAWVRAFVPFVPNRGTKEGAGDTWVRMDPSFKRYDYQAGIAVSPSWSEDEYLQTSGLRAPADFYADKVWAYIRTNNLNCDNLAQVPKTGRIHAENYPVIPSTLTVPIDQPLGLAVDPPAALQQRVTLSMSGATWSADLASLWGRKLTVTFVPATPDDAAIIASYGGLFNTPAYLVRLQPVISIDDQPVASATPVPAGASLDLNVAFQQPNVAADATHHEIVAGETHAIVLDAGSIPDTLLAARTARAASLTGDAALSENLYLTGLRYMQRLDAGVRFASGVRWHRSVKRVFEADVRRQVDVSYTVAGLPIRLVPAENNIDVARLLVGMVPIGSDVSKRAEVMSLAGFESSYREGAIWEETRSQQGISAVKALLLARIAGQQIVTVSASNVDAVLATATLADDVETEIRGAIAQGRIAKLAPNPISLNRWSGTGYVLEDPVTGAATYPISGGLAGGSDTGEATAGIKETLGSESWLSGSALGTLHRQLLDLLGGGGGGGDAPSTTQSDPVNLSSGNMFRNATDLTIVARGIPAVVTRTYNSRSTYNGPLGYGWTFNYGESLTDHGDGRITYREADGSEHTFVNFIAPPGKHLTLAQSAGGWTLTLKEGVQFTFNASGLLTSQRDLNGNVLTINRDGNGNITTVVDATGRTVLTFTSIAGRITEIADVGNRIVKYGYTGDDLTSVIDTAGKVWTFGYDLAHNMTSVSDPLGNTQKYDYDGDDRLMHHTDATGAEEFFHYDVAGKQAVLTDRRGGDRLIEFDDRGRATLEADPAGNVVKAGFDADNNRTQVVDSRGQTTAYEFDTRGNTTKQTNPDTGFMTTTYDAQSRPLVSTDAAGATTTNTYDTAGNLLTSSRSVGGATETTTNTYDGTGQLLTTKDPNGGVTSMTWSAIGTMATRTDAATNTTTITPDALGRIVSIKDPAQNETKLTYDGRDRIRTMTDAFNNVTTFDYDDAGRRTSVTSPRGTTTYTYDAEGRLLSVRDPLGNTTKTVYNAAGDVIAKTDARGNTTKYEYDNSGRATKMTDATGGVWTYGYCAALGGASCASCGGGEGSVCDLTDPNGNRIHKEFDSMGRVASVTDSLGHSSFLEYDKAGRKIVETDAAGNATRFGYDEAGRVLTVTEASLAVTSYTYDKNGNKLTQKDANGRVWTFKYDALNRLIEEADPLTRKTTYTYDALGNLKTKTDAKNQTTTYGYNVRRLMSATYPGGADTFIYDNLGRRTGMSNTQVSFTYGYDALNRVTSVKNNTYNHTVNYTWDAAGNMSTRTLVMNGFSFWLGKPSATTQYTYDAKNRMTSITDPVTGTFRFVYDPMDRRTSMSYPNGVTTAYTYDNAYRLAALATKSPTGAVLDAWSYAYDAVGNRTSKTDMDGKVESYSYDSVYRLTQASYADGSRESFTYDPAGNRKTRSDEAGMVTTYSYDVANQMLSAGADTFTYDANGSMLTKTTPLGTTTLVYDAMNRVTSINGPDGNETSVWSPDGRRAQMNGSATQTSGLIRPIYDLAGNPIADADTGQGMYRYRVYGPGIDEPLAEVSLTSAVRPTSYLHHDALSSITLATDPNATPVYRNSYRAFGQRTFTPFSTDASAYSRLSYTSRENSAGNLYQYRSRYYDAGYGRFASNDEYRGNTLLPPSLHRYVYVLNNPVNLTDPSGNNPLLNVVKGIGVVGGMYLATVTVVLIFCLLMRTYLECVLTWRQLGFCLAEYMSGFLMPWLAAVEELVEVAIQLIDIITMWHIGDIDNLAFWMIVIASLLGAVIMIATPFAVFEEGANPWVVGIVMVFLSVAVGKVIDWTTDQILLAHRRGVI